MLDPLDLLRPRSAISGATDLEPRTTDHAFLALSALAKEAAAHLDAHSEWNDLTRRVARGWLAEGLADRCISRDLRWGTPVPDLPGKVFWCWFDAPLGYLGLTREADPVGWRGWWDPDGQVTITQFLGKDNLPFHTIWFPAVLAGAGGLRLPDRVSGVHWLTWYGQRFSTSSRRGVFLDEALRRLDPDCWRWGLLAQIPETADSRFTWEGFAATVNKDLVGQLGNLVHRLQGLLRLRGGRIDAGAAPDARDRRLWAETRLALQQRDQAHADLTFRGVVRANRTLLRIANRYVDERAPWQLIATDPDRAAAVLRTSAEHLRVVAASIAPIVPHTSDRIFAFLGDPDPTSRDPSALIDAPGLAGREIVPTEPLFARVEAPPGSGVVITPPRPPAASARPCGTTTAPSGSASCRASPRRPSPPARRGSCRARPPSARG